MMKIINVYKSVFGKPRGKIPPKRLKRRRDDIKMNHKGICEYID